MNTKKQMIAAAIALACTAGVQAEDGNMFTLSGFGTVGTAHSTERNADVVSDIQSAKGVGASDATSARLDSRIALQVNGNFTEDFSAVVQAVSEHAVTDSYSPEIALAHVKYRFSPALSVRMGRITAPLYMLSEYQRVSYAAPLVRQPNEVYNFLMAFDGVEGLYTFNAGDTVFGVQAFYGEINSDKIDVDDMAGVSFNVERGASTFRAGYVRGNARFVTDDINRLFDTYGAIPSPSLAELVRQLDPRRMDGTFKSFGYTYDPGNWFVRSEIIQSDFGAALPSTSTSGFVNAGIRHGAWTPSLTFAHLDTSDQLKPGAADPFGGLNMAVAQNVKSRHSYTASLRWDAMDNVALKLQGTHVKNHAGSWGSLANFQPGFQPGRSYNLISASVDFVF